jgi:hypothetical protein
LVSGQKRTGVSFFGEIFYGIFELPSPRNAKNVIKQNREKIGFGFFVDFL